MRADINELSKSVNLPNKTTKKVVQYLKHDMLVALYRYELTPLPPENDMSEWAVSRREKREYDIEINNKVKSVYKARYGKEFDPKIHAKNKKLPLFLMGPPGQGKTAAYFAAAKETCIDMGLRLVSHVTDDYVPEKNDFCIVVQECAGENSAITFGGVPKAEEIEVDGKKVSVLKKAVNYRFTVFDRCAGGTVLFDDAANAAQVIQNVLLPVAQFGSFQGMKINNASFGFTGNLGSLDGTYTTEISSALRTRVVPMFVTDTVKDFEERAYEIYNDSLGDIGTLTFLKRNPRDFAVLPDPNDKSGFACSRSWDNLIQSVRSVVERNGGRGVGEEEALEEIHSLAKSILGPDIGGKYVSYIHSMIMGADPLAKQFIIENKIDPKRFKEKYEGGAGVDEISFGYQFATACVDYTVNMISESDNPRKILEESIKRFGNSVLMLNDSEFSFSIDTLKNKLAAYVHDFSEPTKDGKRNLSNDIITDIARTIHSLDGCGASKRNILISVITDYDKIQNTMTPGLGGTRKKMKD